MHLLFLVLGTAAVQGMIILVLGTTSLQSMALLLALHCAASSTITRLLRFPNAWVVLNGSFPFLLATASLNSPHQELIGWSSLVILIIFSLFFLPTLWKEVPYYPTLPRYHEVLFEVLPKNRDFTFLDAGAGCGSVPFALARKLPQGQFFGIEISPLPFLIAKVRSLAYQNVTITFGNLWNTSFVPYSVVYVFLYPPMMERIRVKARQELQKNACLISLGFPLPEVVPSKEIIHEDRDLHLYVYDYPSLSV